MDTESFKYTRAEVLAYREKWISFLELPDTAKAREKLDIGDGCRCCLGHGAHVLDIVIHEGKYGISYGVLPQWETAPEELIDMCGLYDNNGSSGDGKGFGPWERNNLAGINDDTDATPQEIGAYLRTVILGDINSPFRQHTDFPESL